MIAVTPALTFPRIVIGVFSPDGSNTLILLNETVPLGLKVPKNVWPFALRKIVLNTLDKLGV